MISGVQGEKVGGGVIQNKQRTEHTRHYKDIRCVRAMTKVGKNV